MIVQCPKCNSKYRVDDAAVPVGGAPVRCPSCANIFAIYREPLDIELIPIEAEAERAPAEGVAVAAPEAEAVPEEAIPGEVPFSAPEEVAVAPSEVEAPATTEAPTTVEVPPEVEAVPSEAPAAPTFVKPPEVAPALDESHERAKRLARALVKDIVLYHPQEVEMGLKEGRLSELVGAEIRKSWRYYKERISKDIVESTNYFKDALNEILCKGRKVFT